MRIKALLLLIWLSGFATLLPAQTIQQNQVTTQQLNVTTSAAVAQTAGGTATPTQPGTSNYYYWVVSNASPNYSSPFGPIAATGVAPALSALNPITITWAPAAGVSYYDLLRTTSTAVPTGACNCAVSIGVARTTIVDSGAALQAYTVPSGNTPIALSNQNVSGIPTLECTVNGLTAPCAGAAQAIAPNENAYYASPNCGLQLNCYPVKGGVKWSYDATVTTGNNSVTCSDCNFTSADTGDLAFVTNAPSFGSTGQITSTVEITGTISYVNSTTVTFSANATGSCAPTSCRISWGPVDDTTGLHDAAAAAAAACGTEIIAPGTYFVSGNVAAIDPAARCLLSSSSFGTVGQRGATWQVLGNGLVNLIPLPTFNFASCVALIDGRSPCILGGRGLRAENINIDGAGQSYNGQTEAVDIATMDAGSSNSLSWTNVTCHGWLAGATQSVGLAIQSNLSTIGGDHTQDACGSVGVLNLGFLNYWNGGYIGDNLDSALRDNGSISTSGVNMGAITGTGTSAVPVCVVDLVNGASTSSTWYDFGSTLSLGNVTGGTSANLSSGLCMNQGTVRLQNTAISGGNNNYLVGVNLYSFNGAGKTLQFCGVNVAAGSGTGAIGVALGASTTTIVFYDNCHNSISGTTRFSVTATDLSVFESGSTTGTMQTASNITPSTGWGTSGAAGNGVSGVTGGSLSEVFTITAAGTPSLNPTVSIVFPVAFVVTPSGGCSISQIGGSGAVSDSLVTTGPSATGVTFTWEGTPVAGQTYSFRVNCSNP